MAYWFFWRSYDLAIDTEAFRSLFGQELPHPVRALLSLMEVLGLAQRQDGIIRLTERGAYLSHLVEKEYTHAYLETLWNTCLEEPWPRRVVL
jgi:hypothetical protein